MQKQLLITNCRLLDHPSERTTAIAIENGRISAIGPSDPAKFDQTFDAQGRIAAPGLIDIHIQGAGGADVLDSTPEALATISQTCARFGTTGFLATTVFRPGQNNRHLTVAANHVGRKLGGAELLGIHIEGPFISPQKRGMIQPDSIGAPCPRVLDEILNLTAGSLKIMTLAPELPGNLPLIQRLLDSHIVPAFGHSNATYEETLKSFDAGIAHVTHLFNAMPSIHHRSPGPLVAILQNKAVTAQLIPDGVHIHPAVLKLAFETLGLDRSIPITDGIQALGLPEGKYIYNGIEYESRDGAARYQDGTLIGTAQGMSQLLGKLMKFTGCTLAAAVKTATENPAKLLGIDDRKGSLTVGKDADIILLKEDGDIYATLVGGEIVFKK